MEKKSPIADGLSYRGSVPKVKGSEQDRYTAAQVPRKQEEKVKVGGNNCTIK